MLAQDRRPDPIYWQVLLFVVLLLVLRLTGIFNLYFFEEDEVSIAAGVAAIVRDNSGDLYRYTPQLGYYQLVAFINQSFGGDVSSIPLTMKVLSALMGTLIPCLGLLVFRYELSRQQRWLTALVLTANPIIWKSSQYGNSAMVAAGLAFLALVILSNKPRRQLELIAFLVFSLAVVVRADAILLVPLVAYLLYRQHLSVKAVFTRILLLGAGLLLAYTLLFIFDPRLDDALSAVSQHFNLNRPTWFWEHLIWAMSPLSLILAVLGFRRLLDDQEFMVLALLLWLIPPMAFYFSSTTTPRYFLLATMPIAIATAVGVTDIAGWLRSRIGTSMAWTTVLLVAFLHLVIGLGHSVSHWKTSALYGPRYRTDDGWMPTGALIYDTYFRGGFLDQSVRNEGFGKRLEPHWEGVVFAKALEILENDRSPGQTTVILLDTGYGHAFHFHAQEAGARYATRAPSDQPFVSETWITLGGSSIMTIYVHSQAYLELEQFDISSGDEIWLLGETTFPDGTALGKIPAGLSLLPAESFDEKFRVFQVIGRER